MEPLEFTLATRDFDRYLLPEDSRDSRQGGSERFQEAVIRFYAEQFTPIGGSVFVGVDDENIHVRWVPDGPHQDPSAYALHLLQSGRMKEAIPLLQTLLHVDPDDTQALYNLGMALSDLGELDAARTHLERLTTLAPGHANGLVALGVARQRGGNPEAAAAALTAALRLEPGNGYAHRNLAAVLSKVGRTGEALEHFRAAVSALPDDPASHYGLAQMLEGDSKTLDEADEHYLAVIRLLPDSPVGEAAKRARSRIAQTILRERTGDGVNMAAVMYCLGALERFENLPPREVQAISLEIAVLGQTGIDTNDPTPKYRLKSLPDATFSGLQLMSLMYVGFKQLAPEADIGFDLSAEYQTALQMHEHGHGPRGGGS